MARVVQWRQLCAIARDMIERDRAMTDSAWIEEIKRRLVQLNFELPRPHELTSAIRAVERALSKLWGRRPAPIAPPHEPKSCDPLPLTRDEAIAALQSLRDRGLITTIKPIPHARPPTMHDIRAIERQRALRLVFEAIIEQSIRCDEAESSVPHDAPDRVHRDRHSAITGIGESVHPRQSRAHHARQPENSRLATTRRRARAIRREK
jgi:hypothetical protein